MTMNEKHGAAEWLRGIIEEYEASGSMRCSAMAKMFGIDCKHEKSCRDCITRMMTAIADRIDAERALPEGVEWPRFEDGEPVKMGDDVEFEGETMRVYLATFNADGWALWYSREGIDGRLSGSYGERVKRHAPEVLGADGVPIKVDDTVYCDDDPEPWQVDLIYAGSMGYCTVRLKDSAGIYKSADAPRLSHKKPEPPDSWERIEEDAKLAPRDYLEKRGMNPEKTERIESMMADLVRRAKALAKADSEARGVE